MWLVTFITFVSLCTSGYILQEGHYYSSQGLYLGEVNDCFYPLAACIVLPVP